MDNTMKPSIGRIVCYYFIKYEFEKLNMEVWPAIITQVRPVADVVTLTVFTDNGSFVTEYVRHDNPDTFVNSPLYKNLSKSEAWDYEYWDWPPRV